MSSPGKKPSHVMFGDYCVLMETNAEECESWYYFIRREGNEENLKHLQDQLEKVRMEIIDDYSTFDLDLEHNVRATTAKDMTKVELNSVSFNRKFDGTLKRIDFGFKSNDSNSKKIRKVCKLLGMGRIDEYISDEDIDDEDLASTNGEESDPEHIFSSDSGSGSGSESDSDSVSDDSDSEEEKKSVDVKQIPSSLMSKNGKK
jgi:hypothetical protein